jgi:hypothetical protein
LNEEKIDHEKKLNQSKQVLLAARKKISIEKTQKENNCILTNNKKLTYTLMISQAK